MRTRDNQKQAFEFLRERFKSQIPFTKAELQSETNWTETSVDTYWSKHFEPFVISVQPTVEADKTEGRQYRVTDAFRPYANWSKFQRHVTQKRRPYPGYEYSRHSTVLIYEFFMPLSNETALRTTLDALFYRDTIRARLGWMDRDSLSKHFPKQTGETDDRYFERFCDWVSDRFVGYSVGHVSGRFRTEKLATMSEATTIQEHGGRYLIDETTSVTRFIFPCKDEEDAERVRWFFHALFVESVKQVVNGEEEIWMVERGANDILHTWRAKNEL